MYFPMYVDLSEKKIIVVGGGKIAERRVRTLLPFAESIMVVSPELTEALQDFWYDGKISWIPGKYAPEILDDAGIVLAATDDISCNEQVVRDAHERGLLANASHCKELCDFYFPAIVREDDIVIGICSGGKDHEKVRKVRGQVETCMKKTERTLVF